MRTKKEMTTYLGYFSQGMLGRPCPIAKRLIKDGKWFIGRACVDDYDVTRRWAKKMRPFAGECFYNAQRFCLANLDFMYYEGFYFIGGLPMPHAWVVGIDGKVIDFTVEVVLRNALRNKTDYDNRPPLYKGLYVATNLLQKRVENSTDLQNPLRNPFLFTPKTA